MTTVAAMVELNSDWIGGLAGVVMALFGALAWFIRSTVATAVKELETLISEQTIIQQIYLLCIHQKNCFSETSIKVVCEHGACSSVPV